MRQARSTSLVPLPLVETWRGYIHYVAICSSSEIRAILQSPSVFSISPVPTFTPGAPWVTAYFTCHVSWCTYTFRFALTQQVLANPALNPPMVSEFDPPYHPTAFPACLLD